MHERLEILLPVAAVCMYSPGWAGGGGGGAGRGMGRKISQVAPHQDTIVYGRGKAWAEVSLQRNWTDTSPMDERAS